MAIDSALGLGGFLVVMLMALKFAFQHLFLLTAFALKFAFLIFILEVEMQNIKISIRSAIFIKL